MFDGLCRLNPTFDLSEMQHTSADDAVIYRSPSLPTDPLVSATCHDLEVYIEPLADLQLCRSTQSFRRFRSEPSLVSNRQQSACSFRERVRADCLEEEPSDFWSNVSDFRALDDKTPFCHRVHTKKSRRKHSRRCMRRSCSKSQTKIRSPLSDCDARLNSCSPPSLVALRETLSSLSEDEICTVCMDVFLERYSCLSCFHNFSTF